MSEIILLIVIGVLCLLLAYKERESNKERSKFINAITSKSANEQAMLDTIDKTKIEPVKSQPDIIPEQSLTDEEWMKYIEDRNEQ